MKKSTGNAFSSSIASHNADELLRKAFVAALLLTGSIDQAETAVLEGIEFLDSSDEDGEELLKRTVSAAIETQGAPNPTPAVAPPSPTPPSALPREMLSVLSLAPEIRHWFVLRVLVGWSREICARLLRLDIGQIDERTRLAMFRLARCPAQPVRNGTDLLRNSMPHR